jgi:hypothetical protein
MADTRYCVIYYDYAEDHDYDRPIDEWEQTRFQFDTDSLEDAQYEAKLHGVPILVAPHTHAWSRVDGGNVFPQHPNRNQYTCSICNTLLNIGDGFPMPERETDVLEYKTGIFDVRVWRIGLKRDPLERERGVVAQ